MMLQLLESSSSSDGDSRLYRGVAAGRLQAEPLPRSLFLDCSTCAWSSSKFLAAAGQGGV
jgi:hypothetical protein